MDRLRFDQATKTFSSALSTRRATLAAAATAAIWRAVGEFPAPRGTSAKKKKKKLQVAFACPGPADSTLALGEGVRVGQVFTATRSGTLRQVKFGIVKEADADPGDFVVQLLKTSGGVPDNSPLAVLAASTVRDESVPVGETLLVAKFDGTRLEQGVVYGVVVSRPASDGITVQRRDAGVCEGQRTDAFEDELFDNTSNQDILVSVFVN